MPKCIKVKRMCSSEGGGPEEKYSYGKYVTLSSRKAAYIEECNYVSERNVLCLVSQGSKR
jgi:hypothetical protein